MSRSTLDLRSSTYIGGSWRDGRGDRRIRLVNPAAPDEVLADLGAAAAVDADDAVAAAKEALPAWRATPAPERGRILRRAAEISERRLEEIARTMTLEEGKIIRESRGEARKGISLFEYYAGEGFRLGGQTLPSEVPDVHAYTVREPLGVVGLITPWNFPWAIPVWKVAPAIVAGNTVVLKPASLTPATAALLVDILEEAGCPPGVVNLVVGPGGEVGNAIVDHPDVRAISFTGSNAVGMGIHSRAAPRGIPVTLEMGGKNAVIVMEDGDLDAAATAIASGAFGATGQRCTATSRVVVHEDVAEELLERLVAKAEALRVGPGIDEDSDLAPAVDEGQFKTDLEYIDIARSEGAKLVTGGAAVDGEGYFVKPTIFQDVRPDMRIFREEVFGPVLSVARCRDLDEGIAMANAVEYGLAASLFSRDVNRIMRYVRDIEAGMVHVNEPTIGGEAGLPFGGSKATGVGPREMGQEGIHFFTELKTVFVNYAGTGQQASIR